ncbi:hypothetical protein [uncultured Umboniibacter sp.]|uniref:hypothetical protein n=1 Tax=uncultured Umboniibacter sp. TaxID=1798917 RepID=UPI002621D0B6|nr:hypothetical protein [uncultured Umboniibacter sp.]
MSRYESFLQAIAHDVQQLGLDRALEEPAYQGIPASLAETLSTMSNPQISDLSQLNIVERFLYFTPLTIIPIAEVIRDNDSESLVVPESELELFRQKHLSRA